MSNLLKLNKIVSNKKSTWLEEARWREENETWLALSFDIAVQVLDTLRSKGMTQKEFAEKMNVSPQFINKIVKGQENLSLETIGKLGNALGVKLIEIAKAEIKEEVKDEVKYDFDQAYEVSEILRQQIFARASSKGLVGLKAIQSYETGKELEYRMQA